MPQFLEAIRPPEEWSHTLWNSTDEGAESASLFSIERKQADRPSDLFLRLWYLDICFSEEWSPENQPSRPDEVDYLYRYLGKDLEAAPFTKVEVEVWSRETAWILQMIRDRIEAQNRLSKTPAEAHYLNRPGVYFNHKPVSLDFLPTFSTPQAVWSISLTIADTRLFGLTQGNALLFSWGTGA